MNYHTIQPPASLQKHVRYFWVLEGNLASENYVHRSLADGCVEIVFHYKTVFDEITFDEKREKSFASGISGQSQKFRRFVTDKNFGIFGAYLYPYAVPLLFSFSAADLSNQMLSLDEFLGKEARELEERMMAAPDNYHRAKIISDFLENRIRQNKKQNSRIIRAVNQIIHSKETVDVRTLALECGFSTRQFERKFKELAGFSPKLYQRIMRFQSAANKYGSEYPSLTEIAYDCGYYDQSHFINDFKEFSGYNPKHYFGGNAEGVQWR
ncbi:MAG: AraC family transcriptional regulator [Pyrinomonadaceae bacterium]